MEKQRISMNYEAQAQRTWMFLLTWFRVRSTVGQFRHIFIRCLFFHRFLMISFN